MEEAKITVIVYYQFNCYDIMGIVKINLYTLAVISK